MAEKRVRRKANGEGTIYRLPDGRWRVTVSVKTPGGLTRISRVRQRHADCVALLPELRAQVGGTGAVNSNSTVGEYLRQWLAITKRQVASQTFVSYSNCIDHAAKRIGHIRLLRLTPVHLEQFKEAMATDAIGPRVSQLTFQVLRMALGQAVYPLRLLKSSPCEGLKTPRHTRRDMQPFEQHEMQKIIASAKDTRWHALYVLAFGTGMRAGELFGLRWSDIDTKGAKLSVNLQALTRGERRLAQPKTKSSRRVISLPRQVVDALREHRAIQMTLGLAGCDLVFPTLEGKIHNYGNFYKQDWMPRILACELKPRPFHNTRHTFATLSLLSGVPVPVVSKALGHATPAITMATYAHCLPSAEDAAAKTMQQLLG